MVIMLWEVNLNQFNLSVRLMKIIRSDFSTDDYLFS